MQHELEALKKNAEAAVKAASTMEALNEAEIRFLGRKGELTGILRGLGSLSPDERKKMGEMANTVKVSLEGLVAARKGELEADRTSTLAETEWMDISAPVTLGKLGHSHIVTRAIREIEGIFARIGFVRERGREVDWDYYAFESLNMPKEHPARDEWETFFVGPREGEISTNARFGKMVLTPHTSNAQVRRMEQSDLPIRMLTIGRTFRRQSDASHLPMFHQFEILYVDKGVTLAHLKGVIEYFVHSFFGKERKTRLRPFHFRFTEPSFEIDISCGVCGGTGKVEGVKCGLCKRGWLELGGAGMTHPNVLKAGGVDPDEYGAFALGFGVERTYMMKEGLSVPDIRMLCKNDLRFLKQL